MSGSAHVSYSQIYVHSGDDAPEFTECLYGQRNGLCGARMPGVLFLTTGLHTGTVEFAVEVHEDEPPVGEEWEEVVEVPFRPRGEAVLSEWGGGRVWPLHLEEIDYRVRYCGVRMEEGNAKDVRFAEEPEVDRYLLQFWPAPPAPDRVVRQTSAYAAYFHRTAREMAPPPTPEHRAEVERVRQAEARRTAEEREARQEAETWGGRAPSERLRDVTGNAVAVARLDRDLVDAVVATDTDTQWRLARWVARRALAEAGLAGVDWIAEALAAVERGDPLPPAFGDPRVVWDRLLGDERVPRSTVTSVDGSTENCLQQAMAFPVLLAFHEDDPLRVALDALASGAGAFGFGRTAVLFAEVRRAFPEIGGAGP
ncbi:hypothetical protein L6E12_07535 [Actinokineospora sp. PR83]|uniref:hypothetical protein n=1 Tax=Actinokineospora sp. PR83 TaxID=2884908 RepID=UPI001F2805B5|nr:hypothetical protein [Actinokineospora sp. PR83]MCG8915635.1 hypothetical protein [Actinokineospora sp. PR83]